FKRDGILDRKVFLQVIYFQQRFCHGTASPFWSSDFPSSGIAKKQNAFPQLRYFQVFYCYKYLGHRGTSMRTDNLECSCLNQGDYPEWSITLHHGRHFL